MIVMKFGGSSVADADCIRNAAAIVRARRTRQPVVVVSALAGVTDLLERSLTAARADDLDGLEPLVADLVRRHRWALGGSIGDAGRRHHLGLEIDRVLDELRQKLRSIRILGEETPRVRDAILAVGEGLSARIVAAAFREQGLEAEWVDAAGVMATDDRFGAASPDTERVKARCREALLPLVEAGSVPVIGGFVGASSEGETTTLGRGGSDTSAAVLGLALEAEEIQIWTDVDGMMSADPRRVPAARTLARIGFAEAAELALYGARVLHPDSIAPAVRRQIPVRVLNSQRPDAEGTLVVGDEPEPAAAPVAIASKGGVSLARLLSRRMPMDPGLPLRVLQTAAVAGLKPELLLSSATSITIAAAGGPLEALHELADEAELQIERDCAIVCVVGRAVVRDRGLRERVLAELAGWDPALMTTGALRASLVAVVPEAQLEEGIRRLHERFFEEEQQPWTMR